MYHFDSYFLNVSWLFELHTPQNHGGRLAGFGYAGIDE